MKQTAKRVLSIILSVLMLFSVMSVYVFAENNYKPDEEYYDRIINDAVIVNPEWAGLSDGDPVSYNFRGKTINESFSSDIHFSSIEAAYNYCLDMNIMSPTIILCSGTYVEKITISSSVTILGPNAGINPSIRSDDPEQPWESNYDRIAEANLKGYIAVGKTVKSNIEAVFDGLTLAAGFAYIDTNDKEAISSAVLRNSIIKGAGGTTYGASAVTNVFYFANSSSSTNDVKIENVRCTNMRSTSITGTGVTNLEISGLYYTGNTYPAIQYGDAPYNQNANYLIKDSMFYNNKSVSGVIAIDHSLEDGGGRNDTYVEITGCVFKDDPSSEVESAMLGSSPITFTVVTSKNRLNVHDNAFIGAADYDASVVEFVFMDSAKAAAFSGNITISQNSILGYCNLPDTYGLFPETKMTYTGNYFADHTGVQHDPVYPSDASMSNIVMDYFWIDSDMTIPSNIYHLTNTGIGGAQVDHISKTIYGVVDYGNTDVLNFIANDSSVTYEIYNETMTEKVTELDSAKLLSGLNKNIFYAIGTSSKSDYKFIYKIYISTYDPASSIDFNLKNTYLLSEDIDSIPTGSTHFATWNGMTYKFIVGVTAFSNVADIFNACDGVPTIIIPSGTYSKQITLTESAILLGAKYGVNPNIPQFDNPDVAWQQNPERSSSINETILQGSAIVVADSAINSTVVIDGFTFGNDSGVGSRGENVSTYTTVIIKNSIIDGADEFEWTDAGRPQHATSVFSFAGGTEAYTNNHKDVRLENIRMVSQGKAQLIGDYYETLIMDGVYTADNSTTLHKNEWTHNMGQNFYLEIRNSCFYRNNTSNYYFLVNNSSNDSPATTSNRVVLNNNIFYNTSTNPHGIFGIRFCGSKDSVLFTNNTFITDNASCVIPGYVNWFLGNAQVDPTKEYTEEELSAKECVNNVVMNFNRFVKCNQQVDMRACKKGTVWDMNYNYFADSYSKESAGKSIKFRQGYESYAKASYYYTDWNLTSVNESDSSFGKALDYSIYGPGVIDTVSKTYTDSVSENVDTYDFQIELNTPQASYGIYSDAEFQNKVEEPVAVFGGENIFYIKFSSYDGSVLDVYKAVINKSTLIGADLLRFGDWRISDNAVYACVSKDETEFVIPDIVVSTGATYGIYDDIQCTVPFTANKISGIGATPTIKYIKVVSEDGSISNVYSLSVFQTENDQTELTYIENATKISDTEFEAVIPADSSSFNVLPYCSEGAEITVYERGLKLNPTSDGSYLIDSINVSKTIEIGVQRPGFPEKIFKLTIKQDISSVGVASVFGMTNDGDMVYETWINGNSFTVVPLLENVNATFAVYSDRQCTNAFADNTVVLNAVDNLAYLKVISADGKYSAVYTLKIHTSSADFEPVVPVPDNNYYSVENGTQTSVGVYAIDAAENLSEYELKLNILDDRYSPTTYSVYSDKDCTVSVASERSISESAVIPVFAKYTSVYVKIAVKELADGSDTPTDVSTEIIKVTINSNRPKAVYNDAGTISSWAVDEINFLNDNGFGYFEGDNGNFRPKDNITRFEVAAIAIRVLGIDQTLYSDVAVPYTDEIPNWASDYVKACYKLGIMTGVSDTVFDGKKSTTRQEFAKIAVSTIVIANGEADDALTLYNSNQAAIDTAYNERGFADESNISNWAKPYVRLAVVNYGLINGSNDYGVLNINPKNSITRQEVAVILANYNGYSE